MSYAVPKTRGNSTAEWKWHPKTPKKAKKLQKCHIFPGCQKIPVPYFFVNCFWIVPHRRFERCMNRQWYVFFDLDFVLHHCVITCFDSRFQRSSRSEKINVDIFSETAATAALNCVRDKGVLGLHLVQSTCESFLIPDSDIFGCENVLEWWKV